MVSMDRLNDENEEADKWKEDECNGWKPIGRSMIGRMVMMFRMMEYRRGRRKT
jgi:hypothetical protein